MPFPFPLVPGSHADTSVINNASDPRNMPPAGSQAISQVSGPALSSSRFGRSWTTTEKSALSLRTSQSYSCTESLCCPHGSPNPRTMRGCKSVCVGGEGGRSRKQQEHLCLTVSGLRLPGCSNLVGRLQGLLEQV